MGKKELIKIFENQIEKDNFRTPMELHMLEEITRFLKTYNLIEDEQPELNEKLETIKWEDLMKKDLPPIKWVVDRLIPENCLTIISGNPESYKSFLMLCMTVQTCRGEDFLGHFSTSKKKILYIDEEDGERILRERLLLLKASSDLNLELLTYKNIKLEKDTDRIIGYCLKNKIELVIIDSLIRVHNGDENASRDSNKNYEQLKKFKHNGLTVIVLHHHRKSGPYLGNPGEEMRGSSDILASADCHISIKKDEQKNIITISQNKLRVAKKIKPFTVQIPLEGQDFRFVFGSEVKSDKKHVIAEGIILSLLKDKPGLNQKQIIDELKNKIGESIGETAAKKALDVLSLEGKISFEKGSGNTKLYSLIKG